MTHTMEALIQAALIMEIALCWAAIIVLLKRSFWPLGWRRQDRLWARIDDIEERLAITEMNLEALDPNSNPVTERNKPADNMATPYNDGARSQLRRDIEILIGFEAEVGNSKLFERIIKALKT